MSLHPNELKNFGENNNLGKNFLELMEEGFYYCLLDSSINAIWYLSFSPDKSQILAESSHQPPFTYTIPKDKSQFEREFGGFVKANPKQDEIDNNEISNSPNDIPSIFQKARDFVKSKLEQLTQTPQIPPTKTEDDGRYLHHHCQNTGHPAQNHS